MGLYSFSVDPSLLATFLTVADAGRVLAGARALNLSQPAVTAQIRRLESQLGTTLFLRSARGVSLTPAGRRLYDSARRVHALLERSLEELAPGGEGAPSLQIAASTTIAGHVLPPLIAEFARRRPGARVRLSVGNTDEVLDLVRRGAVPLGLVEGHGRASRLRLEPFVDDEIVACRGAAFPARARRARDLAGQPILWREQGSGTRAVVERALRRAGLAARDLSVAVELGSTEAIKGAAAAGLGIGFLSRWSIREELALGRLVPLEIADLSIRRTFRWALPSGSLSGAARLFHRFCLERSEGPGRPLPVFL
ncbi:MAG: LysR family transcriptional regulator [Elusimicrobia bacterium]|nr:LysR family transcriptional regulator [Elusimicrobiota bacterium]